MSIATLLLLQAVWLDPHNPNEGRCGWEPPPTEPPTRAVMGGWGDPALGLSIRILADSARFDLGATFIAGVGCRFDPEGVVAPASIIDLTGYADLSLRFERIGEGASPSSTPIERKAAPLITPFCNPLIGCVRLDEISLHPRFVPIRLLSYEGEQVPAGRYSITAVYRNNGGGLVKGPGRQRSDYYAGYCWAPPESVWIGEATSAPLEIEIVHREPTERVIAFPGRLEAGCALYRIEQLTVCEESIASTDVPVRVRPGYLIGVRFEDTFHVDASPDEFIAYSSGVRGGRFSFGTETQPNIPIDYLREVFPHATRFRIRRRYVAFETSNWVQYHWQPERGDYRTLAEHVLETVWSSDIPCH